MKRPVIDELFSAILRGDMAKFEEIERERFAEAEHIRVVLSTESRNGVNTHIDLTEIRAEAPWITPYYAGPRLIFISALTSLQSRRTGGRSYPRIDWSFSFDSNVAEKVRAYISHEEINEADLQRIITLIKAKKKYQLQTDILPFLFENLRLSREDSKNERPLNTILAFKKLDYLDWEKFESNPRKPHCNCDDEALLIESQSTYNNLIKTEEVLKREQRALFTQVILFETAIQWLKNSQLPPEEIFSSIIEFCVVQLEKLPKRELAFMWLFLQKPKSQRFFGPLADLSKKLVKDLRGMAWDISHIRSLESFSAIGSSEYFYMPFFVSFDDRFNEILRANQASFMIYDDKLKRIQASSINEKIIQEKINQCMAEKTMKVMGIYESEKRRNSEIPIESLKHILSIQEKEIEKLATTRRQERNNHKN
jgi:hypothetical protein